MCQHQVERTRLVFVCEKNGAFARLCVVYSVMCHMRILAFSILDFGFSIFGVANYE